MSSMNIKCMHINIQCWMKCTREVLKVTKPKEIANPSSRPKSPWLQHGFQGMNAKRNPLSK